MNSDPDVASCRAGRGRRGGLRIGRKLYCTGSQDLLYGLLCRLSGSRSSGGLLRFHRRPRKEGGREVDDEEALNEEERMKIKFLVQRFNWNLIPC